MNPTIYAVVNHDGYITALVNALLLPEIVGQVNAVPAPSPDPFPEPGKAWQWGDGEWTQTPDPRNTQAATAFSKMEGWT